MKQIYKSRVNSVSNSPKGQLTPLTPTSKERFKLKMTLPKFQRISKPKIGSRSLNQLPNPKVSSTLPKKPSKHTTLPAVPPPTFQHPTIPSQKKLGNALLRKSVPNLPIQTSNFVSRCFFRTRTGSVQGKPKPQNQDSFLIHPYMQGQKNQYLFAVFDGHGPFGHDVSRMLKRVVGQHIQQSLPLASSQSSAELVRAIDQGISKSVQTVFHSNIDLTFSGSTFLACLFKDQNLVCANIGDSRAVLGKKEGRNWVAFDLSRDHKPQLPGERERIEQNFGEVRPFTNCYGDFLGPERVWRKGTDVPGLAMSRSVGDRVARTIGVISVPETLEYKLKDEDKFVVLASDGIWEFISSSEVVERIGRAVDLGGCESVCGSLVKEAAKRWQREDSIVDDITIIVVIFNNAV